MIQLLSYLQRLEEFTKLFIFKIEANKRIQNKRTRRICLISFEQSLLAHICFRILSKNMQIKPIIFIFWICLYQLKYLTFGFC